MWLSFFAGCAIAAESIKWFNQAGLGDRSPEARCYESARADGRDGDVRTDGGDVLDDRDDEPDHEAEAPSWVPEGDDRTAQIVAANQHWNEILPDHVGQGRAGGGDRVPDERTPTQGYQLNLGVNRPPGLKIEECGNPDGKIETLDGYTEAGR